MCCGLWGTLRKEGRSQNTVKVGTLEEGVDTSLLKVQHKFMIMTHALGLCLHSEFLHTSPLWSVAAFSANCNFSAGVQGFALARALRVLLVENRGTYFSPFPCVRGESWLSSVPSLASTIPFLFLPRDLPFSDGILKVCSCVSA